MWDVILGGLITAVFGLVGGVISVRWIAPWAATYQRAQQRWEDDLVALDDLLAWELPETVNDLTIAWNELRGELEWREDARSRRSVQAESRGVEIARKQVAIEQAMVKWERLGGPRLELLARHVEHRHTSWGERSVLVAMARVYPKAFNGLPGSNSWDTQSIEYLNGAFQREKETREDLLQYVRKQGANLWPSKEPLGRRLRRRLRTQKSPARPGDSQPRPGSDGSDSNSPSLHSVILPLAGRHRQSRRLTFRLHR
jgi:hypothetical protein